MKKLIINARYFFAPILIVVAMFGVLIGDIFSWIGVALLVAGIFIDSAMRFQSRGAGVDQNGDTMGIPALQNGVMYFMLLVFALLQIVLAWRIFQYVSGVPVAPGALAGFGPSAMMFGLIPYYEGISGLHLIGATCSIGIFAGIGIIYGHELSHTKGFGFIISRLMMGLSGSSHFCYAHVYNHHLELASEDDPATAPRGRSIYAHLPLSYFGQSKFLFDMEKNRLEKLGVPFLSWQNRWIRGFMMSLPSIFLFFLAGGWIGIGCLAIVWFISNFELEALNYLEHYGLIRERGQPIAYHHSWDNSTAFTSWFFIEIGRQADHHDRGETHFWELDQVDAPNTGWGYFSLFALALVPPLWHRYMRKKLAVWDENYANEGERALANRINDQENYHGNAKPGDTLSVMAS